MVTAAEIKNPLRVQILDCSGGQGHKVSADAVESALKAHFGEEKMICNRRDIGSHLMPDFLDKLCCEKLSMIDLHNMLARNGHTKAIKFLTTIGQWIHTLNFSQNVEYFKNEFQKMENRGTAPDLVISVVPLVNAPLIAALKEKNIPVLVVTTDGDSSIFSHNWPEDHNLGPHRYAIPYNCYEIAQRVNSAVKPQNIRGIGYPTRPEFTKEYTAEEIEAFREELGIEGDKKVVSLMMGGLGGSVTQQYLHHIAKAASAGQLTDKNMQFNVFCGKRDEMKEILARELESNGFEKAKSSNGEGEKYLHENGTVISILGFTKNVHKYMAMSELWITKPGSSSWNECLAMNKPMLIDTTVEPLPWEELNVEMANTHGFGESVKDFDSFIGQLNNMVDTETNRQYRNNLSNFRNSRPQQKNFSDNIVNITKELLAEAGEERAKRKDLAVAHSPDSEQQQVTSKKIEGCCLKETVSKVGKFLIQIVEKVIEIAIKIFTWIIHTLPKLISALFIWMCKVSYFSGFNMDEKLKVERRASLIKELKAAPIEGKHRPLTSKTTNRPIDALHIRSQSEKRTGNAVVFVLGKEYQGFNPDNYKHLLEDGADVILFNPTDKELSTYAEDLKCVIDQVREDEPNMHMVLHGYCIGAHVAGSVGIDRDLPVVFDRGFGDGYEIARKITPLAYLMKGYIDNNQNLHLKERIAKSTQPMLFISPKPGFDQMNHTKERDFTRELAKLKQAKVITLEESADHWTTWSEGVHNQVKEFLQEQGILSDDYREVTLEELGGEKYRMKQETTWARRHLLPVFI